MNDLRRKYIGDKAFYAAVFAIIVPLIIQQGITQFVNLLDNVMVGRLGTAPMSGVAIVNQIMMVFNLTIFGGLSGASIFGAQFYGKGDQQGLRDTFRFRVMFCVAMCVIGIVVFLRFGEPLFKMYLNEEASGAAEIADTLQSCRAYTRIMLWGLLPFALGQCYSSALRDTGETFSPMVASVIAILVNLVLNYLLIFGSFGFPRMGVAGAALATVISRYLEALYLIANTYRKLDRFPFLRGVFKSLKIPLPLVKRIAKTGAPLLANETLWSLGIAMINMCYSSRGLTAVAAVNINATVSGLFSIMLMAQGNAMGIMSGQLLGAGEIDRAKDTVRKLLFFGVTSNALIGLILIGTAPLIPHIYNTEPVVRETASRLLMICGMILPINSYANGSYFTIRSGGKTFITFLFDCVFTWVVSLSIAYVLSSFTGMSVVWMYFFVEAANIIKCVIGALILRSGIWARNVVEDVGN